MLSNGDKSKSMSDTVFVQDTLRAVYTVERFGSVKAAQTEAYDFIRMRVRKTLTMRRVRAFFEGKAKVIHGEEKDAVRAAQIEEARREYNTLRSRLASLEAALARTDSDFHGPSMDAYRGIADGMGRNDSAGNQAGE